MTNLIGQSLGRYHILEQLGEGGMATVYKAYDTRLERDVAVKVIRTEKLTLDTIDKTLKRFEREAKALAKLTHPNIVPITDYGEHEGKPYLVMPYLPGGTLKQRLGKPIPWEEAVRILIPVARGLHYAHHQGIVHRDVKPSNILITQSGEPMLTDFGIAKILIDTGETSDLTGTGMGVGTPEYMSPEQFQGKGVDARTDIYSLGVVLYEMVTGRKPYQADTPAAILIKQATDPLPRPSGYVSGLPDVIEKVLLKALAKDPEDRYQSMAEFAAGLEGSLSEPKTRAKVITQSKKPFSMPARLWLPIIGLIILLSFGLVWGIEKVNKNQQNLVPLSKLVKFTETPKLVNTVAPIPTASSIQSTTKVPTQILSTGPSAMPTVTLRVSSALGWQSTGMTIEKGSTIRIEVIDGRWTSNKYVTGFFKSGEGTGVICADIKPSDQCSEPLPTYSTGGLIGQIGNQLFGIGNNATVESTNQGVLSMRINDDDLTNNNGTLFVNITITNSVFTPSATTTADTANLLLSEDFEDGNADEWKVVQGKWEVVQESTGNHVYSGTGDALWGFVIAGKKSWTDYSFEARFKGVSPTDFPISDEVWTILMTRVNWGANCYGYTAQFGFDNGWVTLGKTGDTCNKSFPGTFSEPAMGQWYTVRFDIRATTLSLYVDGTLVSKQVDNQLQSGYVGLAVSPNTTVYFDDIRVTEIQQ